MVKITELLSHCALLFSVIVLLLFFFFQLRTPRVERVTFLVQARAGRVTLHLPPCFNIHSTV